MHAAFVYLYRFQVISVIVEHNEVIAVQNKTKEKSYRHFTNFYAPCVSTKIRFFHMFCSIIKKKQFPLMVDFFHCNLKVTNQPLTHFFKKKHFRGIYF